MGREIGVEYERLYEVPVEGFGGTKRRRKGGLMGLVRMAGRGKAQGRG